MLTTLRNAIDPFTTDLKWFQELLPRLNGVCLYSHRRIQGVVQVDASLQDLGGCWDNQVYKLTIPMGYSWLGIVQLEMINVFLALRVWDSEWACHQAKLECDNEAVVAVLMQGRTRDPVLTAYAHNIRMIASFLY